VPPLVALLGSPEQEPARSARRALNAVVRRANRPGARAEMRAVEAALLLALKGPGAAAVRRELLWLLSEAGGEEAVAPVAALLQDPELREDARCVLLRLPERASTRALQKALTEVPEDFRPAIADALRSRGLSVKGYPSRKKVPTKETTVGKGPV
jgi:HEAT repeat protein